MSANPLFKFLLEMVEPPTRLPPKHSEPPRIHISGDDGVGDISRKIEDVLYLDGNGNTAPAEIEADIGDHLDSDFGPPLVVKGSFYTGKGWQDFTAKFDSWKYDLGGVAVGIYEIVE